MRALPLLLVVTALAAGCGSGGDSKKPLTPEQVVRAWSTALNRGDNKTAAYLFADGAKIEQGTVQYDLPDQQNRLDFNSGLPCSGNIVELHVKGDEVTATFQLGERADHHCDAPGQQTTAVFTVRNEKIVAFRQLPAAAPGPVA